MNESLIESSSVVVEMQKSISGPFSVAAELQKSLLGESSFVAEIQKSLAFDPIPKSLLENFTVLAGMQKSLLGESSFVAEIQKSLAFDPIPKSLLENFSVASDMQKSLLGTSSIVAEMQKSLAFSPTPKSHIENISAAVDIPQSFNRAPRKEPSTLRVINPHEIDSSAPTIFACILLEKFLEKIPKKYDFARGTISNAKKILHHDDFNTPKAEAIAALYKALENICFAKSGVKKIDAALARLRQKGLHPYLSNVASEVYKAIHNETWEFDQTRHGGLRLESKDYPTDVFHVIAAQIAMVIEAVLNIAD